MDAPLPVLLSHPQPKEDPGPEFYEDNSEECLNYNIDKENEKINKAMFDDLGLNKEDEQSNIIDNFKKLYNEFSVQKKKKHIPPVDPYTKIKQLEIENEKLKNFVMKKNKRAESCGNYENSSYI